MRPTPPADPAITAADDPLVRVAALIGERAESVRPAVIGLAGGVASGKSTTAAALQRTLTDRFDLPTEVVSTDGFLLSNQRLTALGIMHRKGFPDSYDVDAIRYFLDRLRSGDTTVVVPLYDHLMHDVLDEPRTIVPGRVVIIEGVNALQFADAFDLSIHLHAEEPDMRSWYLDRLITLRRRSATEPSPFFSSFAALSDEQFLSAVEGVWEAVNLRNLVDHIEPASAAADIIIAKRSDHSVESVLVR